ncbi:MAG: hypothetical protein H6623_03685 [Bdellovibrionaceae bacterium]|nr:hypothetical protein [Pseudobdellovibrionaceae bacterium]
MFAQIMIFFIQLALGANADIKHQYVELINKHTSAKDFFNDRHLQIDFETKKFIDEKIKDVPLFLWPKAKVIKDTIWLDFQGTVVTFYVDISSRQIKINGIEKKITQNPDYQEIYEKFTDMENTNTSWLEELFISRAYASKVQLAIEGAKLVKKGGEIAWKVGVNNKERFINISRLTLAKILGTLGLAYWINSDVQTACDRLKEIIATCKRHQRQIKDLERDFKFNVKQITQTKEWKAALKKKPNLQIKCPVDVDDMGEKYLDDSERTREYYTEFKSFSYDLIGFIGTLKSVEDTAYTHGGAINELIKKGYICGSKGNDGDHQNGGKTHFEDVLMCHSNIREYLKNTCISDGDINSGGKPPSTKSAK